MKRKLYLLALIFVIFSAGGMLIANTMASTKTEIQMQDRGDGDDGSGGGTIKAAISGDPVATPFRVYMTQDAKIETLFLTSLNNTYITITNNNDAIVYSNRVNASGNTTTIIDISKFVTGSYTITISNLDYGIVKYGLFEVQ